MWPSIVHAHTQRLQRQHIRIQGQGGDSTSLQLQGNQVMRKLQHTGPCWTFCRATCQPLCQCHRTIEDYPGFTHAPFCRSTHPYMTDCRNYLQATLQVNPKGWRHYPTPHPSVYPNSLGFWQKRIWYLGAEGWITLQLVEYKFPFDSSSTFQADMYIPEGFVEGVLKSIKIEIYTYHTLDFIQAEQEALAILFKLVR